MTYSIKTDVTEAVRMLAGLGSNSKSVIAKILRAVGTQTKKRVKGSYRRFFSTRTGTLYKSIISKLDRDKMGVVVYPVAQSDKQARYGFVLAAGYRNGAFFIPGKDYIEAPGFAYLSSGEYMSTIQKVLDKEVARLAR